MKSLGTENNPSVPFLNECEEEEYELLRCEKGWKFLLFHSF